MTNIQPDSTREGNPHQPFTRNKMLSWEGILYFVFDTVFSVYSSNRKSFMAGIAFILSQQVTF